MLSNPTFFPVINLCVRLKTMASACSDISLQRYIISSKDVVCTMIHIVTFAYNIIQRMHIFMYHYIWLAGNSFIDLAFGFYKSPRYHDYQVDDIWMLMNNRKNVKKPLDAKRKSIDLFHNCQFNVYDTIKLMKNKS